jgi:hypothetical protein
MTSLSILDVATLTSWLDTIFPCDANSDTFAAVHAHLKLLCLTCAASLEPMAATRPTVATSPTRTRTLLRLVDELAADHPFYDQLPLTGPLTTLRDHIDANYGPDLVTRDHLTSHTSIPSLLATC